jgi:uncharacterized membrane protein YtjA (UPF0391 family)
MDLAIFFPRSPRHSVIPYFRFGKREHIKACGLEWILCLPSKTERTAASRHSLAQPFTDKEDPMLYWALVFFVIALIAAIFGFTGLAAAAAGIAKILFFIFVVLFIISLIFGLRARPRV